MAIRLSKAFNTSPQLWLNLQQQFDLWQAQQKADQIQVKALVPRAA
jgi:plasmid maintenance system antidote protein VapI